MDGALERHLEIGAARLSGVVQRACFADPLYVVETREQRIDDLQSSMTSVLTNRLHGLPGTWPVGDGVAEDSSAVVRGRTESAVIEGVV